MAQNRIDIRGRPVRTEDFRTVNEMPYVSEPDNKRATLFPKKIGGCYAMLDRLSEGSSIWISFSEDLVYWGQFNAVVAVICSTGKYESPTFDVLERLC